MAGSTSAWFLHLILERTFQLEGTVFDDGRFLPPQYQSIKPIQPHLFFIYHWTPEGRVVDPYMVALYGRKFTLKTVVIMCPSYL